MSDYIWQLVSSIPTCYGPVSVQGEVICCDRCPTSQVSCPGAPRQESVPLDTPVTMVGPSSQDQQSFYPIHLTNIANFQEIELKNMILISPVHIHTPTVHLGLIQRGPTGQHISARNIVFDIQAFSRQTIDRTVYAQLSGEMKLRVKEAFMHRHRNVSTAGATWNTFLAEENTTVGPIGADLLLGCTAVWGLESVPDRGFSVIHLA